MAKIVVGCGYLGMPVARRWLEGGHTVTAVTRSGERAREFADSGLQPVVADITESLDLSALKGIDTVLVAVGYDRSCGKAIHDVYVKGLRRVLSGLPKSIGRLIYISSTGVYGQTEGQWVDEDAPCRPQRAAGQACLEAEKLLAEHPLGERTVILRLAGIYGPGRVPRVETIRAGEPLPANPDSILNLIHIEDAVEAVLAAEQRAEAPRCYLVSDGNPVVRREFYAHLAELIDAEPPRFVSPGQSGSQRDLSDKRVSNKRMLNELDVTLRHPDFRSGLSAIFEPSEFG
jgi:nucleoside-diphosphate-sugar epimerase